ncbi:helix-turn-helix domain-containing protein [Pseudomonas sp. DSP3-2-2]|uniref:helix-turn-helix domain-containing protein n=2 Tax=unclassified Pseudomonas TaxID=196821 RepID=UPI003CEA2494
MKTLHVRLRNERIRVGMPQYLFAAVGGVKPNAQVKYESGRRLPRGDYLAAIAVTGIDLLFILTGKRSVGLSQLTGSERLFIAAYRDIEGADKQLMSHLLFRLNGVLNDNPETRNVAFHDGIDAVTMFNG